MSITQQEFDQGLRAKSRFYRLIDAKYRSFLRAITKRPSLEVTGHPSGAFTDGSTVYLPIPLALGDETLEHDKSLCGQRDPVTLEMLCPFCLVEDRTDGVVLHESAHMTEGSFEKIDGHDVLKSVKDVFGDWLKQLDPDQLKKLEENVRRETDAMKAASHIDTWFPFTLNVVEDIYVNRRLFKYRQGAELPLRLFSREIFEQGIEDASNGKRTFWKDGDESAQAIMSAYLRGQNLPELAVHLDPKHNLVDDPKVIELVDSIPSECKPEDRIEIALKLMAYLRELGYCPPKSDTALPPQPPEPSPQGDPQPGQSEPQPGQGESGQDEQEGEQESGDGDGEEGGDETQEGDGDGTEGSADDDQEGDGDESSDGDDDGQDGSGQTEGDEVDGSQDSTDGTEGEASDDGGSDKESEATDGKPDTSEPDTSPLSDDEIEEQAKRARELLTYVMGHDETGPQGNSQDRDSLVMERVLKQEGFDHPSDTIGSYSLVKRDDPRFDGIAPTPQKVPRNALTPSLSRLRVVFAANHKTGLERSLKRGPRLDVRHLHRIGTQQDNHEIFAKRNVPKARDWFVVVGLDFSGSTGQNGAQIAMIKAGHAVGELLHELGIRFAMYAHSSGMDYDFGGRCLEHVEVKGPDTNWKANGVQDVLFAQRGRGVNLDGHSLEQYRKVVEAQRATDKMVMYFTDGEMPNANFDEELRLLKENIEILKRQRTHIFGVGYRTDAPKNHGLDTIRFSTPEDIPSIVKGLEDRLLR